jgi:hypothetical protein
MPSSSTVFEHHYPDNAPAVGDYYRQRGSKRLWRVRMVDWHNGYVLLADGCDHRVGVSFEALRSHYEVAPDAMWQSPSG